MDKGLLVPDDVVIGIIESRLAQPDAKAGYILDGFPRTVPQAQALDDLITRMDMAPDAVVNINASVDMVVRRLTGRRTCRDCQAVYHVVNIPPKKAGVCDRCGGKLYQRDDDTEETIRKRIQVYMEQTAPLLDYYQESGKLTEVSGDSGLDKVYASICDSLP
jgi:adenylate kinase